MATRTAQTETECLFFCTITCYNWIPLFAMVNFYDHIYNWFNLLNEKGILLTAFVIMPNHLHCLLYLPVHSSINDILGNAKRFMAYDIVKRLKKNREDQMLSLLRNAVEPGERKRGKLHEVFEPSFDAKPIFNEKFLFQKLNYIHHNPVKGKWSLAEDITLYPHSSAAFYELGKDVKAKIVHYKEIMG